MLFPISRSVYNALQMKLVQNVANPFRGVKSANFQISYALSRFINPLAFQGNTAPSQIRPAQTTRTSCFRRRTTTIR